MTVLRIHQERQLNPVADEVLALTAVVRPILSGVLYGLKADVAAELEEPLDFLGEALFTGRFSFSFSASLASPVAISTMRFAHWFRSRGRLGGLVI